MHPSKLDHYRERLLVLRGEFVGELEHVWDAVPEEVHPVGEHEVAPSEGIDVEQTLEASAEGRVREIDAALQRVRDGVYGVCTQCGEAIPDSRLEATPYASECIACASVQAKA